MTYKQIEANRSKSRSTSLDWANCCSCRYIGSYYTDHTGGTSGGCDESKSHERFHRTQNEKEMKRRRWGNLAYSLSL